MQNDKTIMKYIRIKAKSTTNIPEQQNNSELDKNIPINQLEQLQVSQQQQVTQQQNSNITVKKDESKVSEQNFIFENIQFKEQDTQLSLSKYWLNKLGKLQNKDFIKLQAVTYDLFSQYKGIKFYTDGGASPSHGGPGGYGVLGIKNGLILSKFSQTFKQTTNNRMELMGVLSAIKAQKDNVWIATDSQYTIFSLTKFRAGWFEKNKLQGDQLKNLDLLCEIFYHSKNKDVKLSHVKGHNGDKFNEIVDQMTKDGRGGGLNDFVYEKVKIQQDKQKK